MVQPNICGSNGKGLVKIILQMFRDFDLIHKRKITRPEYGNVLGCVDFEKRTIYLRKDKNSEMNDTNLHELRHIFQEFYMNTAKWSMRQNEEDAEQGSIYWSQIIYKGLEE